MNSASKKLSIAWWILRVTYGFLFILVGADKFFNRLTDWHQFVGATASHFLPISGNLLLHFFGAVQILAGILLFTRWILYGIYLIFALLLIIFVNLFSAPTSFIVIGHDIAMIVGIIVLWQLTMIRKS